MTGDAITGAFATPALIDQLYPEIATIAIFLVAIVCMIALVYISMTWD